MLAAGFIAAGAPLSVVAQSGGVLTLQEGRTVFVYNAPVPNALGASHTVVLEWLYRRAARVHDGVFTLNFVSAPTVSDLEPGLPWPYYHAPGVVLPISRREGGTLSASLRGVQGPETKVRPAVAAVDYIDGHRYRLSVELKMPASTSGAMTLAATLFDLGPENAPLATPQNITPPAYTSVMNQPVEEFVSRAKFHVRITHLQGSGVAAFRSLTVNGQAMVLPEELGARLHPFLIERHPVPAYTGIAGEAVTFTASATGASPLGYQWQRRAVGANDFVNLAGATSASLTLPAVQAADRGDYRAVITGNGSSIATEPAVLTVYVPPPAGPRVVTSTESRSVLDNISGQNVTARRSTFTFVRPIDNPPGASHSFSVDWLYRHSAARPPSLGTALTVVSNPNTPYEQEYTPIEPLLGWPSYYAPRGFTFINQYDPGYAQFGMGVNTSDTYNASLYPSVYGQFIDGHRYRLKLDLQMPTDLANEMVVKTSVYDLGPEAAPHPKPWVISYEVDASNPSPGEPLTKRFVSSGLASLPRVHLRLSHWNRDGIAGFRALSVDGEAWEVPAEIQPANTSRPVVNTTLAGNNASMSVMGLGSEAVQWQRNGRSVPGATAGTLALTNIQPADTGLYTAIVGSGANAVASTTAIVGATATAKVTGAGVELEPRDIKHPNGNIFDQVLLTGVAETITADHAIGQITRTSFVDLDGDIVQVEFSGPGTLSLVLDGGSGPAPPENYHQPLASYMKGHPGIVIIGATEQTNVSVFTVGRATAFDPTSAYNIVLPPGPTNNPANNGSPLFQGHASTNYDGIADIAFIAIRSSNGKFGGVRTSNVNYFAERGVTGVFAPGVALQGPLYIGDISAFDDATPMIVVGSVSDARITGGDMLQDNGEAVLVDGMAQLKFTGGSDSHGKTLAAQPNRASLFRRGEDVTAQLVVNP